MGWLFDRLVRGVRVGYKSRLMIDNEWEGGYY